MSKHKPIQIHIPQPCHEDWAQMTPQQKGRFCDSCQKCVVDFTNFSDTELYTFLQEHQDQKVCGRFKSTQLNRAINLPPQPHSTLYKWIVAAGLALVISALPNSPTFAQAPVQQEQVLDQHTKKDNKDTVHTSGILTGEPVLNTSKNCDDTTTIETVRIEEEVIMGLIAPPPVIQKVEIENEIDQMPARNTNDIISTAPGVLQTR